jgi:DNA-3-methyladenine glycosylase II
MSPAERFLLPYEGPLDWPFFLRYLGARATPGVEAVVDGQYLRTVETDDGAGVLRVGHEPGRAQLTVALTGTGAASRHDVARRVSALFDLQADMATVQGLLGADAFLGPIVRAAPGVRIPGAWSPFELLVRTIVGQQVTVRAATTIMGRIVARLGKGVEGPKAEPRLLFPSPREIAEGDLGSIGMPGSRIAALQQVAGAIAVGAMPFLDEQCDGAGVREALLGQKGIGPWTVAYFALRALRDADAWPATDLVLRRAVERFAAVEGRGHAVDAGRWSPYRGYVAMHLWNAAAQAAAPAPAPAGSPPARG